MIAITEKQQRPKYKETTGAQTISYSWGEGILRRDYTKVGTYVQLRAVRKAPTVQLCRHLLISCIQAGSWNIEFDEGVSDEVRDFMNHILPLREDFIYNTVAFGKVDFGWCGFEKLFEAKVVDGRARVFIKELKPLLHDMTHILVESNGRFKGYKQRSIGWGTLGQLPGGLTGGPTIAIDILAAQCIHVAFGVEAGNYYGMPLLENIREVCDMWHECNDGARRYDQKLAGSKHIIHFPPGSGEVNGVSTPNAEIAEMMMAVLESSGSIAMPSTTVDVLQQITNSTVAKVYQWDVELLSETKPKQESFSKRMKHLEALKARGLLFPERSILEGTHGTKAEAGEHIGLLMTNMEELDRAITRMVNQQLVNQLLRLNFGEELVNKIRLVSAPLIDEQIEFLRKLYMKMRDPNINLVALKEKLDVPEKKGGSETKPIEPEGDEDD